MVTRLAVSRKTTIAVAAVIAVTSTVLALAAWQAAPQQDMAASSAKRSYPSQDVLKAVYFDLGPASGFLRAAGLPALTHQNSVTQVDRAIQDLRTSHPAFEPQFPSALRSGDPYLVESALERGSRYIASNAGAMQPGHNHSEAGVGDGQTAVTFIILIFWRTGQVLVSAPDGYPITTANAQGNAHALQERAFSRADLFASEEISGRLAARFSQA
jgi:hypothetical protein